MGETVNSKFKFALSIMFILFSGVSFAAEQQEVTKENNQILFNGVAYIYRWSQSGQYEFTPKEQENLESWNDMLTIWRYPQIKNGEELAQAANSVLGNYQKNNGKIITTNSVPKTDQKPAEHFIAAVIGSPEFLEFVEARFVLVNNCGYSVIYSHRVYGKRVGNEMSQWMESNGPVFQNQLMSLNVSKIKLPKS